MVSFNSKKFQNNDFTSLFEQSNLQQADFREAINYTLDPEVNKINKTKFDLGGLPGLLRKYEIIVG